MAGRGNPFSRDHSIGNSSEGSLFPNPIPEEKGREHLYSVDNEVVNDLRRHTRDYVNKIGGLPIILMSFFILALCRTDDLRGAILITTIASF